MPRAKLSDVQPIDEPQSGRAKLSDVQPAPLPEGVTKDTQGRFGSESPSSLKLFGQALFNPVGSGATAYPKPVEGALQAGGRAMQGILSPLIHPIQAAEGLGKMIAFPATDPRNPLFQRAAEAGEEWQHNKPLAVENAVGDLLGGIEGGRLMGGTIEHGAPLLRSAGAAVRESALGDPNVAALRGLKVSPSSPKGLRTIGAVEGARPFLKGAQSLEDLQSRIGHAKEEIWSPYKEAIDVVGKRPVRGPDGVTTIGDLEQERLQLSALNRGLKERNPEAIRLAEQKGLSQADLLKRENQVKASLDPALQDAGINPSDIRQAFGQVAEVGNRISGKTTLAENPQPSGIGRMLNMKLENPRTWIGEPAQGARDIIAGRPLWSAKPTDLNIREAFRTGGEKPDFGAVKPLTNKLLPSSASTPEGEEPVGPWQYGVPSEPTITPAPRSYPVLTSQTGPGEVQPMIMAKRTPAPELNESTARTRVSPPQFLSPGEPLPPSLRIANPPLPEGAEGPTLAPRLAPRGLLPGGFTTPPVPEPSSVEIYPPGSTLRGAPVEGTQMYPSASQFHTKIPAFNLEEYLRNNP